MYGCRVYRIASCGDEMLNFETENRKQLPKWNKQILLQLCPYFKRQSFKLNKIESCFVRKFKDIYYS